MSLTAEAGSLAIDAAASGAAAQAPRYAYRLLAPGELPLLNALYNEHYRCDRPLEEAVWLYHRNPNGPALIYAAFDESGQLAGMRPAIPFRLCWRGTERIAYEFADALVSARHRGRGIFSRLVKLICDQADRQDFTLFSIPNANSLPIYRRSPRLQVVGSTDTLARPIAWYRYLARRLGMRVREGDAVAAERWRAGVGTSTVYLEPVDRFGSDFDDVHAELALSLASFTQRRRDFLQWRYFGSPVREYRVALVRNRAQIRGYVVLRMIDEVAHLVDVFLPPDRALAREALELVVKWAAQMGAIAVHFNASRGNFLHAAAARAGFWLRKRSGSLVLDRHSGKLLESRQGRRLRTRDVYFVMGDFDFL